MRKREFRDRNSLASELARHSRRCRDLDAGDSIIPKVDHGAISGELRVWMPPSRRKVLHYRLRHAPLDAEGIPIREWAETTVTSSQGPVCIKNLKPGTAYAFQVRALGKLGFTDWSDTVTKMCT
jgi:Fibronectin type III domain